MRFLKLISLSSIVTTMISGCDDGSFSNVLDAGSGKGTDEAVVCKISTVLPSSATLKIAASGATQNFVVGGADSSCTITWKLNGTALSGTSVAQAITSSLLTAGITNTLTVEVSNATTSDTHSWALTKNNAPTCVVKAPASNPAPFAFNVPQTLFGAGTDADGDSLSNFVWKYDDVATPALFSSVSNSTLSGTGTFTSEASGTHKVAITFSDGYDTGECFWTMDMTGGCSISSTSPTTASPVRMAATGGTQAYNININNGSCIPTWTLNAAPLSGSTSTQSITSSQLAMATNVLTVTITNGVSTDTKTWNILRNTPPTCLSKSPASNPTNFAYGSSQAFIANGTDSEGDTLTGYTWKFNDSSNPALFSGITTGVSTTSGTFTPTVSQVGTAQKVSAVFFDGYDYGECSWTMPIITQCTVASSFPSTTSYKLAQAGTASQDFTVIPNDGSCTISWSLGGTTISGSSALRNITSSMLSPGAGTTNTLVATVSNGSSSATRTWNLARNQVPSCGSKTPATNPSAFVYTDNTKVFSGTPTDPDGDTITNFTWKFNDSASPAGIFTALTPASPTTTQSMTLAPTASQIGTGQKLSVVFSDGYDTGECYWNFDIANSCTLSSTSPSGVTNKVATAAGGSQNYVVVPNDSACTATWTLTNATNPTGLALGSGSIKAVTGSQLDLGSGNSLAVTVSNGVSSASKTWTVTRNNAPTCNSKSPVANPTPYPYTTGTVAFSGTGTDADGDTLSSLTWKFNDSASPTGIYTSLTTTSPTSSMTLVPSATQVGSSQKVAMTFSDGYDTGECYWNFDIVNPNTVSLVSCSPNTSPIVLLSTGGAGISDKDLLINVTNGTTYRWTKDGANAGNSTSLLNASSASLAAQSANYVYRAYATDSLSSPEVSCVFNVKRNAPPVISGSSPLASQTWRVAQGSTLGFSATATDANSDTLSYSWKVDGSVQASYLNSTTSTATFSPSAASLVTANNPHTISVTVSDGYESATQSWTVEVNNFADECNTLLNGTVAAQGGKICTLSGVVGVGSGRIPASDPSKVRIQPLKVIEDAYGNWFFTDALNHTVSFWNRTGRSPFDGSFSCGANNSTCSVALFGKTALGATVSGETGGVVVLTGNGSGGQSDEDTFNTSSKLNLTTFGGGLALDAAEKFLYITDFTNNRVVRMNGNTGASLGKVQTIIGATAGGTAPTNAAGGNTDGNAGTTHWCTGPADVMLAGSTPNKYLYVTCYSSHVVKRMKADFSGGDSVNYGKTYTFVGGLVSGVSTWSPTDGAIGNAYGAARTIYPTALSKDTAGNIYWTEGLQGGTPTTGGRVRVYNNSGGTLTLFNGNTSTSFSSISFFGSEQTALSVASAKAGHPNSVTLNYGNALTVTSPSSAAPVRVRITGPSSIQTGTCAEFRMTALNASNVLVTSNADTAVGITIAGGTGDIYNNSGCTTNTSPVAGASGSRTVSLLNGTTETVFYYKNTASETRAWTITNANGIAMAAFNGGAMTATNAAIPSVISYAALGAPDHIAVINQMEADTTKCVPVKLQMQVLTTNAPAAVTADRYFRISTNAVGSMYSNNTCTTPTTAVTMLNGTSEAVLYYKSNINIANGEVGSIMGFSNSGTTNPTSAYPTTNTAVTHANMNFSQPRGLAVYEVGGVVKGFFITSYNLHRIYFMNNSNSSITVGANSVPAYYGSVVVGGNAAGADAAGQGVATRINTPSGITMNAANSGLVVADQLNYRIRTLDVTGNDINDILGSSYGRSGSVGAAITKTNEMYYSSPSGIAVDNTNRKLYISDSGSRYIRVLDLLQGKVDTFAGNGSTNLAPNDGNTPTLNSVNSPRGLAMHNPSGKSFLLYVDSQNAVTTAAGLHNDNSNGAIDQFCLVGGFNIGATSTPLFTGGSSVLSNRFVTALGNQGLGCGPYGTGTYTTSANNNDNITLFNPEGVASDGTNIFVTNRQDHCILKVKPDGSTQVVVGTGTGTNVRCIQTSTTAIAAPSISTTAGQASAASTVIKYPTAIAIDPRYASDGNFFFADAPDVTTGSVIRYANFRATSVTVGNITVNGSSVTGEPYIKTITFVQYMNPTSTGANNYGWVNGMAAVTADGVTQLCVAGGRHDNAMLGNHNITCYAVSTASAATTKIVGGTPTTALDVRSGAPLGAEQEGILSDDPAVKLFAPYGLTFDTEGNLYFSERGSHTIRFVRKWW